MNKLNLIKIIIPNKYNIYFKAFHQLAKFIIINKFMIVDNMIMVQDNKIMFINTKFENDYLNFLNYSYNYLNNNNSFQFFIINLCKFLFYQLIIQLLNYFIYIKIIKGIIINIF